jgi:hypothetical protein
VGLEPIQCRTLYDNGYGSHDIQGIGDKHVTWIHHVGTLDALMCIDDRSCLRGLQLFTDPVGSRVLERRFGTATADVSMLSSIFGISGICNLLGAIKTAKYYGFGKRDPVVTVLTDDISRYRSVMEELSRTEGPLDEAGAVARLEGIFHGASLDWIQEGTIHNRNRWHNLKYYTWVEQQGKTVSELDAQRDPEWWVAHQKKAAEVDEKIREHRNG